MARARTRAKWAKPVPKGSGARPLSSLGTIVVNSSADRLDGMLLTEVVEALTMVPPAVDALEPRICSPSFNEEPLTAGTSGLTRGRLQRPRSRRAGDHPLVGVGLKEPQRRRARAVRLCVFRYGALLKSIPCAVSISWELTHNSVLVCKQARRPRVTGGDESRCQRCGRGADRQGRTRDEGGTPDRLGCPTAPRGAEITHGRHPSQPRSKRRSARVHAAKRRFLMPARLTHGVVAGGPPWLTSTPGRREGWRGRRGKDCAGAAITDGLLSRLTTPWAPPAAQTPADLRSRAWRAQARRRSRHSPHDLRLEVVPALSLPPRLEIVAALPGGTAASARPGSGGDPTASAGDRAQREGADLAPIARPAPGELILRLWPQSEYF